MSSIPPQQECAKKLAVLEGKAFQDAVTSLIAKNHLDFQAIPAAPQGDGGLDGLIDGHTVGYCCYGIEDVPSHSSKELVTKMVDKFKKDLMRILEFDPDKSPLTHQDNTTLANVLPSGKKLKHIYLVCNNFDNNTAIGKLTSHLAKLKAASKLTFIEQTCTITIEGPAEITNRLVVTADYQARLDQTLLTKLINQPSQSGTTPASLTDFEDKMQVLGNKVGATKVKPVEGLLKKRWLEQLGLIERLNSSVPSAHMKVFSILSAIREEVVLEFADVGPKGAIARIKEFQSTLGVRLHKEVPLPEEEAKRFAMQVVAQLVGESGMSPMNY
jgi:hypothetical protein